MDLEKKKKKGREKRTYSIDIAPSDPVTMEGFHGQL